MRIREIIDKLLQLTEFGGLHKTVTVIDARTDQTYDFEIQMYSNGIYIVIESDEDDE